MHLTVPSPTKQPPSEHKAPAAQRERWRASKRDGAQTLSLGELAAAVAHELSQPLAAILSNSQAARRLLAVDNPDLEEIRLILDDISADDTRAVEILTRIRSLINREQPTFHPVEIDALVRSLAYHMREEAQRSGVRIAMALNAARVRVPGDAVQLDQALSNLVRNGIQAMEVTAPEERLLTIRTAEVESQTIEVTVEDRGEGVPKELLGQIFKSFYSTKPAGMGIGLAITRSTIEMHGGRLSVSNNPDHGATFRFTLPLLKEGTS